MASTGSGDREALERFVIENDDLLSLESQIGRFNIFDALGISRLEIRHSNFLAFILDPAESHGQGQLFLKAILMDLLKNAPAELRPLSPIDLDGTDLRGIDVKREWMNIDLLITCEEPQFAIVIENKVDSQEHSDQLRRYRKTMASNKYREHPALYVYLSPDSDKPSDETWVSYSYASVFRVLNRVRKTYENAIGDDVLVFLEHYLNLLGTRFMNNEQLDDLCQRIYKNHRQALDLIYLRGRPASGVLGEVASFLKEDKRLDVVTARRDIVDFVPLTWREWLPQIGIEYKDKRDWIIFRFLLGNGKLAFYIEVQHTSDAAMRKQVAEALIAAAPSLGFKPKQGGKVSEKYTKVSGSKLVLEWDEDDEPEAEEIRVAVMKMLDELHPKLEKLESSLKTLCKTP